MKRLAFIIIYMSWIMTGCKQTNQLEEGFYIQNNYLKYSDKISDTNLMLNSDCVVIKVSSDTIKTWGDIIYWGKPLIIGEVNVKQFIFRHKNLNKIFISLTFKGERDTFEFVKTENNGFVTSKGLDFERLAQIKSSHILTGKYTCKGEVVNLNSNGNVSGLQEFTKFKIYLKRGTNFPYPSTNLIYTDNGIWDFKFISHRLILTRYEDTRNDTDEQFKLSDKIIELIKH